MYNCDKISCKDNSFCQIWGGVTTSIMKTIVMTAMAVTNISALTTVPIIMTMFLVQLITIIEE